MAAVLAEVLNFTTMLSLFAKSPTWDEMTDTERVFEVWIFIEALVICSTVAVNVIFIFIRSLHRVENELSLTDEEDVNQDFLNNENNQMLINTLNQACGPILVYYFFHDYFESGGLTEEQETFLD